MWKESEIRSMDRGLLSMTASHPKNSIYGWKVWSIMMSWILQWQWEEAPLLLCTILCQSRAALAAAVLVVTTWDTLYFISLIHRIWVKCVRGCRGQRQHRATLHLWWLVQVLLWLYVHMICGMCSDWDGANQECCVQRFALCLPLAPL